MKKKLVIVLLSLVCVIACAIGLAGCSEKVSDRINILCFNNDWYTYYFDDLQKENLQSINVRALSDEEKGYYDYSLNGKPVIGYEFQGVFTERNGGGAMIFDKNGERVNKSLTIMKQANVDKHNGKSKYNSVSLYSYHTPIEYTVIFDSDGGTECESIKIVYDTELKDVGFPTTEKYGNEFQGWFIGQGQTLDNEGHFSFKYTFHEAKRLVDRYDNWINCLIDDRTIKLTASWSLKNWQVHFNYSNDSVENETVSITHGDSITDDKYLQKDTGDEIIIGWNTEDGVPYNGEPIERDTTLTAVWEKYKTVSFFDGSGVAEDKKVTESHPLTELPAPDKQGYSFDGWYDNAETTGESLREITYNGADSFYAKWTPVTYYVNFNGVTPQMERLSFTVEDETVLPDPPERENYAFKGWYEDEECTKPILLIPEGTAENVRVYAKFIGSIPVSDAADLIAVSSAPEKYYHLTQDINLGGQVWEPIGEFKGILDGKGHTVKNFSLSSTEPGEDFGFIRINGGTVKNLRFTDFVLNVSCKNYAQFNVGVIVGRNKGEISDCNLMEGVISVNDNLYTNENAELNFYVSTGGICGFNTPEGKVIKCCTTVNVEGTVSDTNWSWSQLYAGKNHFLHSRFGGVIGSNMGAILNCVAEMNVKVNAHADGKSVDPAKNYIYVGGIVGEMYNGTLADSYAIGDHTISTTTKNVGENYARMGSIVGHNYAIIKNSYGGGTLGGGSEHESIIGGFVGINREEAKIENCYCMADVSTEYSGYAGGFVGVNYSVIQNSYSIGFVRSNVNAVIGGFAGAICSSGSISKCYSTGEASVSGGKKGYFVGDNKGVLFKCYIMSGTYERLPGIEDGVEAVFFAELWSKEFLSGELYWDEEGWIIITDDNPILSWETEIGHDYEIKTFEPDCEHGGFIVYGCKDCNRLFIKDFIDATGHNYEFVRGIQPTCTADGYTVQRCSVCGDEMHTDTVEKTGHPKENVTLKDDSHKATCIAGGYVVYSCSACNSDFMETQTALGHSGSFISRTAEPTCTARGEDKYYCSVCGSEYTVSVDCIPHSWVVVDYLAPSCGVVINPETQEKTWNSVRGHEAYERCSVCQTLNGYDDVPFLEPHELVLKTITLKPTCTAGGEGVYECKNDGCGFVTEECELDKLAHADKNFDFICDDCGELLFTDKHSSAFKHIKTAAELAAVADKPYDNYWLDNDIDLTGIEWSPIGTANNSFRGTFYGAGHTISGLSFTVKSQTETAVLGLFAYNTGNVYNLNIKDFYVKAVNADCVFGGIAAYNSGNIIGCRLLGENVTFTELDQYVAKYTKQELTQTCVYGGIVGYNRQSGIIRDCAVSGSVNGTVRTYAALERNVEILDVLLFFKKLIYDTKAVNTQNVYFGGIAGDNSGTVGSCEVTGTVTNSTEIVASVRLGKIEYNIGFIEEHVYLYAGAFVGYNTGDISDCRAKRMTYTGDTEWNSIKVKEKLITIMSNVYAFRYNYCNYSESEAGLFGIIGTSEIPITDKNVVEIA